MPWRVLIGNRNGESGAWVSKSGYDVSTCSEFDMQFSSNWGRMRVIAAGQVSIGYNGNAFQKYWPNNGETIARVAFDKEYVSPLPVVVACFKAANFDLYLNISDGNGANLGVFNIAPAASQQQFNFYANTWMTPVVESCGNSSVYSALVPNRHSLNIATRDLGRPGFYFAYVHPSWGSIKFMIRVYNNFVDFVSCNTAQFTYVNYIILDPSAAG